METLWIPCNRKPQIVNLCSFIKSLFYHSFPPSFWVIPHISWFSSIFFINRPTFLSLPTPYSIFSHPYLSPCSTNNTVQIDFCICLSYVLNQHPIWVFLAKPLLLLLDSIIPASPHPEFHCKTDNSLWFTVLNQNWNESFERWQYISP